MSQGFLSGGPSRMPHPSGPLRRQNSEHSAQVFGTVVIASGAWAGSSFTPTEGEMFIMSSLIGEDTEVQRI